MYGVFNSLDDGVFKSSEFFIFNGKLDSDLGGIISIDVLSTLSNAATEVVRIN